MAKSGAKILFGLIIFVAIAAGLAGAGAWYYTEDRPAGYRATAILLLEAGTGAAPEYAVLFSSAAMAMKLRDSTFPEWTLEAVQSAMKAETRVALQTNERVVYQPLVQLHITAPDPALAAEAANAWAGLCESYVAEQRAAERTSRQEHLNQALQPLRDQLATARQRQDELRAASPLESLEIAARARAESLEELKSVARHAQAVAARGDAALKAFKAYVTKAPPAVVIELSMAEADAEAETAGARAESEFLSGELAAAEAAAAEAGAAWAAASRDHESVESEIARLLPQVRELERALDATAFTEAGARIAAEAVPPQSPAGPRRYALVAGSVVLGAIAGLIVYFGLLTLRVYARELDRA